MNYKIIITGPVGSGKTTAVNTLTDRNAILTDATVSDSDQITQKRKKTTTVAMDYDVARLDNDNLVHVYGTPGQERFDFMWDILSQGAHGVVLLLDNSRNYPFRDLKYYTGRFSKLIKASRLIIGVTRFDLKQDPTIETYQHWLKTLDIKATVVAIDAREKDDILKLFYQLLEIDNPNEKEKQQSDVTVEQESPKPPPVPTKETIKQEPPLIESEKQPNLPETTALEEGIVFDKKVLEEITKITDVTGVSLTNAMGELLDSTINDDEINEFTAFLSGITPDIENILNRGKINRIMLRSPNDENLTIIVEKEKSLAVSSNRRKSVQALSQQIEDMLQWM